MEIRKTIGYSLKITYHWAEIFCVTFKRKHYHYIYTSLLTYHVYYAVYKCSRIIIVTYGTYHSEQYVTLLCVTYTHNKIKAKMENRMADGSMRPKHNYRNPRGLSSNQPFLANGYYFYL